MPANLDVARLLVVIGGAFARNGARAYLVGGTVRDELLGRAHSDLDFTTAMVPSRVKSILAETRPRAIFDVGERFGTIGAVYGDENTSLKVEITTFRTEAYQPGSRKPSVAYGESLIDDLARRDLTINAIARDIESNEIVDPFDGRRDLESRLVRAVGNPVERFAEDPLRMLRAVRLAVELGFEIDRSTAEAIRDRASDLQSISRERVIEEMNRILSSKEPGRGVRFLAELGLLAEIVPDLIPLQATGDGPRSKDVFAHTVRVVDKTPPDLVTRWAALLHDIAKPRTRVVIDGEVHFPGHDRIGQSMASDILTGLRLDTDRTARVAQMVGLHMRANMYEESWTDGAVRRLMRDAGDDLDRLLSLSEADVTSERAQKVASARARAQALRERCRQIAVDEEVHALRSPLDGNDLMALFQRGGGPWIAPVKNHLLDLVLDGTLAPDDREGAIASARAFIEASGAPRVER